MSNTEISRVQKPHAGDYPLVPGFRCVCVVVPDDVGYVQLLNGFVSLLVKPYNWQGTFTDRGSRADLWAEAVAMTDFEGCTDCVQVADCIDTSEVVQSALSNWFVGAAGDTTSDVYGAIQQVYQNNVGGQPMPESVSGQGLYDTGCVEDVVFGGVVYLIDQFDTNIIDAFEIAEELSNALERVKLLISAIPVFETLPIDEVIDYAQALWTDDLFEAYSSAVTTDYLNELKCDLFCIALANGCTLSIDLLFHYFVTRVGGDPTSDLLQLIEYLTLGVWTGTQVPDTFFALQLIAMKLGNQFFTTIGIKSVVAYMAIGAHMPDSTWTEICDDCPTGFVAQAVALFDRCGEGAIQTVDFTPGVPFTLDAVEIDSINSWYLALLLPDGDWQVELNTFTGTIVPPADLNQDAYSWQGTDAARHDVQWNAPATPADFGTQDTRPGSFAPWCSGQNWNLVLFNDGIFSATFTVTAL